MASFGSCKTLYSLARYARLEGFLYGELECLSCKRSWKAIMYPNSDQRECPLCGSDAVLFYPQAERKAKT